MAFPTAPSTNASPHGQSLRFLNPKRPWLAFGLIIAGALALTLYRLGSCGICKGNEAVEAIFIQQMVEHGKLLFPSVNARLLPSTSGCLARSIPRPGSH